MGSKGELLFFTNSGNKTLSEGAAQGPVATQHSEKPLARAS